MTARVQARAGQGIAFGLVLLAACTDRLSVGSIAPPDEKDFTLPDEREGETPPISVSGGTGPTTRPATTQPPVTEGGTAGDTVSARMPDTPVAGTGGSGGGGGSGEMPQVGGTGGSPPLTRCDRPLEFADVNLERSLRSALGVPSGPILPGHAQTLTRLVANYANITDLDGIECLTRLEQLGLGSNYISNLEPLASMTQLRALSLPSNRISDVSPLASLIHLEGLELHNNLISDITPLAPLRHLSSLWLQANDISDITALSGMGPLQYLCLASNQISDITPLATVSLGWWLCIGQNQISDLTPLTQSPVLAEHIMMHGNPIDCDAQHENIELLVSQIGELSCECTQPIEEEPLPEEG